MKDELDVAEKEINALTDKLTVLKEEIGKRIVGQQDTVEQLLITFLAGGHGLLEGVPGLAKTLMIRTLAEAIDLDFRRIQFTPDLMPSDIIGTEVLEEDHTTGKKIFQFNKGPIFSNIILADEINRTPPKTQAAMLEAMQEFAVTYAGKSYSLPKPFFLLATQNPVEQSGTFPLPEAQLDRFLLYIRIGYPSDSEEEEILRMTTGSGGQTINRILTGEEILRLQQLVREIPVSDSLIKYVSRIVRASRPESGIDYVKNWVAWGAGPRAGQAMILTAKANALLHGRWSVTDKDLRTVAYPVLRHRILVNFKAEARGITADDVTNKLLEHIDVT